jgi:flavodoxin I
MIAAGFVCGMESKMFRFDERDPQFLIVYTGDQHAVPDDYRELGRRWLARLEREERFGILIVYEPHEHHDDEDEAEQRQQGEEINRIINDFRRDYREKTAQFTVGYAWVIPPEWVELYYAAPGAWEHGLEQTERQAQYNWGIPGSGFISLSEAQAWLRTQFNREADPVSADSPLTLPVPKHSVGLFYGSSTGITEYIAAEITVAWQAAGMKPIQAVNIGKDNDLAQLLDFDCLILGVPTWNIGQLQDDWDILFPQLDRLDFSSKKIALFGVGDQYGYPDNFLDALGILGDKLRERGATLVGDWYDEHYEFTASRAFVADKFIGLGLDETHQAKLTLARIQQWIAQIIPEFGLSAKPVEDTPKFVQA